MSDTSPKLDGLTRVSVRDARRQFAELLNRVAFGVERIVIERHGRPVAAIVCVEDLDHLEAEDDAVDRKMVAEVEQRGHARTPRSAVSRRTGSRKASPRAP